MKKVTLGTPEALVPSVFCKSFSYTETEVRYPIENIRWKATKTGLVVEFPLEDDCHVFGFGLQLKQFDHRGHSLRLAVNADPVTANGESHAPVPFFVTNKGYAMYFDTARYAEFACGKQKNLSTLAGSLSFTTEDASKNGGRHCRVEDNTDALYAVRQESGAVMTVRIPAAEGVDVYIIEGDTITDMVAQYNMLSGGGCDVPEWGLGVLYRCFTGWSADKILETVDTLRGDGIPLSIVGLEPGWQTHAYSCTYKWSDRYPDPAGFVAEMQKRGLHLNLWEHAFTHPDSPIHDEIAPYAGDYLVWGGVVPDFATKEARKIFADYHRDNLVSMGIDGFKLDECDSSDNTGGWSFPLCSTFPSGLDGEQYHSLFGTLYAQTILDALGDNPTLSEVRQMGALAAPYPFVLYSDLYNHKDFVRGVVNSGFSGLLWTPEFRQAGTKEECIRRIQAIVFSVQCLINAWCYDGIPWKILDCDDEVREVLCMREALIPMLKEAFEKYHKEGVPPVRALVMDYSDDAETWKIDDQWLFCEDLLVAPIIAGTGDEREVYLPAAAKWADYFTGEAVESGWHHVNTKGIPVYRRIG